MTVILFFLALLLLVLLLSLAVQFMNYEKTARHLYRYTENMVKVFFETSNQD